MSFVNSRLDIASILGMRTLLYGYIEFSVARDKYQSNSSLISLILQFTLSSDPGLQSTPNSLTTRIPVNSDILPILNKIHYRGFNVSWRTTFQIRDSGS